MKAIRRLESLTNKHAFVDSNEYHFAGIDTILIKVFLRACEHRGIENRNLSEVGAGGAQ